MDDKEEEYEVLEFVDVFYPEKYLTRSDQLLSLYLMNGRYDAIFVNSFVRNKHFRLFHLPKCKENEVKEIFAEFCKAFRVVFCEHSSQSFNLGTLQTLCNLIRTQKHWSLAHIAVRAGIKDIYSRDGPLSKWIDCQQCENLYTPLHMASRYKKEEIASSLVADGADLSKRDIQGNTPLHVAVEVMSNDIFETISAAADDKIINMENIKGETALHVACRCNQPRMCQLLIKRGADPLYSVSIPSPIHYALKHKAHKAANALIKICPDILNPTNNEKPVKLKQKRDIFKNVFKKNVLIKVSKKSSFVSLHAVIACGQLNEAVDMVIANAPLNEKDQNGNTPLHLSVLNDHVMLVKMLLLFEANCCVKNNNGDTPKRLAEKSCLQNKDLILDLLASEGRTCFDCNAKKMSHKHKIKSVPNNGYKVLCLDGGGIRGLVLTQMMILIEKLCRKKTKDIFGWIVGTSVGGIMALCLAQGKSANYVQRFYFRLKDEVFEGPRPYGMGTFLTNEYGVESTMESIANGPKVLLASVKADRKPVKLHFFKNYTRNEEDTCKNEDISNKVSESDVEKLKENLSSLQTPLWKAACCSAAAPTYFRPVDNFIDGGLLANNPTLDALSEIHRYNESSPEDQVKKIDVVLSLGTGDQKIDTARSVDVFRPKGPKELVEAAKAGIELSQLVIEAACEKSGHVVERARSWCEMMGTKYFRLNPLLDEEVLLDEVDNEKLIDLMWTTRMYLKENAKTVIEIIEALSM